MSTRRLLSPLKLAPFLAHLSLPRPVPAVLSRSELAPLSALSWFSASAVTFPATPESIVVSLESHSPPPFERITAPLAFFEAYLRLRPPAAELDLYLAQETPPAAFLPHLTPPSFLASSRITQSSLWIGLAPTLSPLHQDPDSNVLYQLAGIKLVRLLDPVRGKAVLDQVRGTDQGSRLRGEEMMSGEAGGERDRLERVVWDNSHDHDGLLEAKIEPGEALFIPKGWWHAVRGVNPDDSNSSESPRPVTASVNWWFR